MSATITRTHVPSEYLGQARQFRNQVIAEFELLSTALDIATRDIRRRARHHPAIRKEHLVDLRRSWANLPRRFRLSDEFDGDHNRFYLAMHQCRGALWSDATWHDADQAELGITVCTIALMWHGDRYEQRVISQSVIGLHALARWHQRSGCTETDGLVQDLRPMGYADTNMGRVLCSRGTWLCAPAKMPDGTVLLRARTFIEL
jgi:hypothetical protein